MNRLWNSVKIGMKSLSEKSDEWTRIGRTKLEIISVKRRIEQAMLELGGRVYDHVKSTDVSHVDLDEDMQVLVEKIQSQEAQLKVLEDKLERIRKESGIKVE